MEDKRKSFMNIDLPPIRPLRLATGAAIFGGIVVVGLGIGAAVGTQIFFGVATLIGMVVVAERSRVIRYIVIKGNLIIDVILIGATIVAVGTLGPTIAGGLTIAGLGFTTIYSAWLRREYEKYQMEKQTCQ